ncbi:uncharacterized protein RHOBADRAFT_53029 [Rhodotorula graminis WP1]|uniref:Nuclear rim protein 1 n=1 Tax=Rhodotorula graminis (strain WP1) TaxID=578459 RepID=A0A194S657_RHOGW|nr:uncharacterized protein RHOBADRAFT_53029 [Rhodotorula graminis WP1]KPV76029.1 hypothetical protein RHOBADRAFT_53029 [Rhodotorula graminis WP1]
MPQTPSSMRSRPSSASLEAPNAAAASPSSSRHSTLESRRALGARASGMARDPGTPVGRLLAAEGLAVRSPRRVRHRSLADKVIDWPSNALMSLETSVQLLSFESAGYPAALAFHLVHLVVRVSAFVPSLTSITSMLFSSASSASRYVRRPADALGDADARLEALQRASQGRGGGEWGWWAWTFSALLILVSVGNSAYLASRRRKYQMVLRRDPLASPNARSTMLDFSPSKRHVSFTESVRRRVKAALGKVEVEESHAYPVQELQVWTPERVLWSLRFFTLYPPPVALMYHFLALDNCVPFAIVGGTIVLTIYVLVHLYSTLVSDRAALQAEVMHEYNAKFVNPRVFVAKRDACVSTSQAEMVGANDWLRAGRRHVLDESLGQDDEQHVVVRGSGRRASRRDSSVPSMQQREVEGPSDSPVPRRSRPRPSMLG